MRIAPSGDISWNGTPSPAPPIWNFDSRFYRENRPAEIQVCAPVATAWAAIYGNGVEIPARLRTANELGLGYADARQGRLVSPNRGIVYALPGSGVGLNPWCAGEAGDTDRRKSRMALYATGLSRLDIPNEPAKRYSGSPGRKQRLYRRCVHPA